MSKVFLDTEFVDDGSLAEPVSLAPISETRPEYYGLPPAATSPEMLPEAMIAKLKVPGCAFSPWLRSST